MLRTLLNQRDASTAARLHRGLDLAHGATAAVDVMARTACFSQRQFHRLTLRLKGETPGAHQRRLRLDRAAWLLLSSGATVLDVALETGWESHESFTRAFRSRFGVTPSAFRKAGGRTLTIAWRSGFSIALHAAGRLDAKPVRSH